MKTLEDIKKQFEDKTAGGLDINILAYHPDQADPIIVEVNEVSGWQPYMIKENGQIRKWLSGGHELVKKKKTLPADILCEVWESGNTEHPAKRYSDGFGGFFSHGCDEFFDGNTESWSNYKVIKNPIHPWFGGECPIPKGIRYRILLHDASGWGGERLMGKSCNAHWKHDSNSSDIIAYQILGEEE